MELSFGQRIDPENGLVESWFTHGALDEIKKMDLRGSVILQFGSGLGDAWLAKRCHKLICIERNEYWLNKSQEAVGLNGITNTQYIFRPCNEGSGREDFYTEIPEGVKPDVVIVDDAYRYECILKALTLPRPLILIVDNWQQDFVFMCPAAEEAMKEFKGKIFVQENHTDHEGHPWKTSIWELK